jgi:RHH-type proline utilization regulon transcriptional repressor/proline dehydrogenase/delta 1-pyrroline-5-carboxylate dehydrogenase
VGVYEDLLSYLVRRLLENGANTSFVNRLADDETPLDVIVADPVEALGAAEPRRNPRIPLPAVLFPGRRNSEGVLLTEASRSTALLAQIERELGVPLVATPSIGGVAELLVAAVQSTLAERRVVGRSRHPSTTERAVTMQRGAGEWDDRGGAARAEVLERAAQLFELRLPLLVGLCVREAGKTVGNALGDVREAVDFLRFYAAGARAEFAAPLALPGPTGERNELRLHGRGVFACISPWNFPLAIFTGQVAAALAAGNAVVKPRSRRRSRLVAIQALHEAGVPGSAHFLPGWV